MRILASLLLLLTPAALFAAGPAEMLKDELVALEEERMQAYADGNSEIIERHLAAEYLNVNYHGGTTTREQELAFYAPGRFSLGGGDVSDATVRDYGDVAVLQGKVIWTDARYSPKPGMTVDLSGEVYVTRVYVKRDGRWQLAASQSSKIYDPSRGAGR